VWRGDLADELTDSCENDIRRTKTAGFDLVYVYAAHGLSFLSHFLSRRINDRTAPGIVARLDWILVASRKPIQWTLPRLRERVAQEPFKSALEHAWRVSDLEGVIAHFVARPSLADAIAQVESEAHAAPATDDRSPLEFRFARELGMNGGFSILKARELSTVRGEDLPDVQGGRIDRERVVDERVAFQLERTVSGAVTADWSLDQEHRAEALAIYNEGNPARALAVWRTQKREPRTPIELELVAEVSPELVANSV